MTADSKEAITVYSVHVAGKFAKHYIWRIGKNIYLMFPNLNYGDMVQCYDAMIALKLANFTDIQCIVAALKTSKLKF